MQQFVLYTVVLLAAVTDLASVQKPAEPATQRTIRDARETGAVVPPGEFAALIGKPDHVLLDVRTPEEYAAGHLAGATLIDFHSPDFEQKIRELSRDKTYLVYCRSGRRSHLACVQMQQLGFSSLVDLQGGIQAWHKESRPVQGSKP